MSDKARVLINIPTDENYIEILGYKIDGFKSFEAFCEHLKKYAELEEENKYLKDKAEGLINGQISLQKHLSEMTTKVESKKAVMNTMARCIDIQENEIERLKKLLAESEARENEAAKRFYKEGVNDFAEPNEKPCIYKHTCGFDVCMLSECPDYEPKTKGKKWFEEEGADNV